MFGYVLVNAVVGETRERVGNFVYVDFGFFGSGGFGEVQSGGDHLAEFALVEKFRALGG